MYTRKLRNTSAPGQTEKNSVRAYVFRVGPHSEHWVGHVARCSVARCKGRTLLAQGFEIVRFKQRSPNDRFAPTAAIRKSDGIDGKRKVIVVIRERGGNSVPAVRSIPKAKPPHSSVAALPRARSSTPTKWRLGITFMSVSRSRDSIIRRHTTSMALALTWLRNTSPACAAPRSASTTTSRRVSPALCAGESSWREVTAAFPTGIR